MISPSLVINSASFARLYKFDSDLRTAFFGEGHFIRGLAEVILLLLTLVLAIHYLTSLWHVFTEIRQTVSKHSSTEQYTMVLIRASASPRCRN